MPNNNKQNDSFTSNDLDTMINDFRHDSLNSIVKTAIQEALIAQQASLQETITATVTATVTAILAAQQQQQQRQQQQRHNARTTTHTPNQTATTTHRSTLSNSEQHHLTLKYSQLINTSHELHKYTTLLNTAHIRTHSDTLFITERHLNESLGRKPTTDEVASITNQKQALEMHIQKRTTKHNETHDSIITTLRRINRTLTTEQLEQQLQNIITSAINNTTNTRNMVWETIFKHITNAAIQSLYKDIRNNTTPDEYTRVEQYINHQKLITTTKKQLEDTNTHIRNNTIPNHIAREAFEWKHTLENQQMETIWKNMHEQIHKTLLTTTNTMLEHQLQQLNNHTSNLQTTLPTTQLHNIKTIIKLHNIRHNWSHQIEATKTTTIPNTFKPLLTTNNHITLDAETINHLYTNQNDTILIRDILDKILPTTRNLDTTSETLATSHTNTNVPQPSTNKTTPMTSTTATAATTNQATTTLYATALKRKPDTPTIDNSPHKKRVQQQQKQVNTANKQQQQQTSSHNTRNTNNRLSLPPGNHTTNETTTNNTRQTSGNASNNKRH